MRAIIGYTGFVGSNICDYMSFDFKGNSKNVTELYGTNPDLLVYAGVKGTKFLANRNPEEDRKNIEDAKNNIIGINSKKIVLISSVDVYDDLDGKDESYVSHPMSLHTYGRNRLNLEEWLMDNFSNYHIIRIPALYGKNLKKNFIHDMINPIPAYLSPDDLMDVSKEFALVLNYYKKDDSGMFRFCDEFFDEGIYSFFCDSKFNSLRFTDSRAKYQFFDLKELADIIMKAIELDVRILNVVTEPVSARNVYRYIMDMDFVNELPGKPISYNIKTMFGSLFNSIDGESGYLHSREYVLEGLKRFVVNERKKLLSMSH